MIPNQFFQANVLFVIHKQEMNEIDNFNVTWLAIFRYIINQFSSHALKYLENSLK